MSPFQRLNIIGSLVATVLIVTDVTFDISWAWYLVLIVLYITISVMASFILSWEFYTPVKSSGQKDVDQIALTFDDGPIENTKAILEILNAFNVKATFFCIGKRAEKNGDLLRRIDSEGHLIGNHSYLHQPWFGFKSSTGVLNELLVTEEVIACIILKRPRYFRPPFGVTNPMIASAIAKVRCVTIGWSIRSFDPVIKDPEKLYQRVTRKLASGDIILFHDYSKTTVAILPSVIEYARSKGLEIVGLDRLLNEPPYR